MLIYLLIICFLFFLYIDVQQLFFISAQQSYMSAQQRIISKAGIH